MNKYLGITLLVLGIAIAAIPQFTNCYYSGKVITLASGSTIPMKCLWSARAELATGISLLAVGAMMTSSRRRESVRNLSIVGGVVGAFVMLLPTSLIGVCQTPMNCNIVMRPAMLGLGSLAIVTSLVGLMMSRKSKEGEI